MMPARQKMICNPLRLNPGRQLHLLMQALIHLALPVHRPVRMAIVLLQEGQSMIP